MLPPESISRAAVTPEALLRLELLLGERVVDLASVAKVVSLDAGLRTHILQVAHDTGEMADAVPTVHECLVEIGIEGLKETLRQARMRRLVN